MAPNILYALYASKKCNEGLHLVFSMKSHPFWKDLNNNNNTITVKLFSPWLNIARASRALQPCIPYTRASLDSNKEISEIFLLFCPKYWNVSLQYFKRIHPLTNHEKSSEIFCFTGKQNNCLWDFFSKIPHTPATSIPCPKVVMAVFFLENNA